MICLIYLLKDYSNVIPHELYRNNSVLYEKSTRTVGTIINSILIFLPDILP